MPHQPVWLRLPHLQHVQQPPALLKSQLGSGHEALDCCVLAKVMLEHGVWYPVVRSIVADGQ